ncbi:MAG: molybdopterin synthase sulfur carrier subunit [Arenicella sp.]|jgi:molybdopterin synthase sulfur carrier subunit
MIKVLFFAHLRDIAGANQVDLSIGDMTHVRDLLRGLLPHVPIELIEALEDQTAMVSVNQKYAGWDAELIDGAEVGILPPVSGG